MDIFKIEQAKSPSVPVTPVPEQQAQATTESTGSSVTETPSTTDSSELAGLVPENRKNVVVKIDGPVGRVFTEALNGLLATESYLTMAPLVNFSGANSANDEKDNDFIQIYSWNADELNISDVVEITNDISKHTERNYVIALESIGMVTNNVALLSELGKLKNVKVCYSRDAGLNAVLNHLRR